MLRGLLLLGATLPLVGLGSGSASHVRNGRIAFEHIGETGAAQIYSMTPKGTKRRLLTPTTRKQSSRSPAYSPRGRRIAYVGGYKQDDLWTMHPDGSHQRPLTRTKHVDETDPGWSPDGKEIVFAVARPASLRGIWVIGVDGRHRRQLTSDADANPSWSPDGTEIAFDRHDHTTQIFNIFLVPAGGGTPTDLSSDPGISDLEPDWSPDGSRILFSSDRPDTFRLDLWVMKPDGSHVERITNTDAVDEANPAWSPDSRRIVFVGEPHFHGSASYQLYVRNANGANLRKLTHDCGQCTILNVDPTWQPLP